MMKQSRKYAPDPETLALRAELQAAQSELALLTGNSIRQRPRSWWSPVFTASALPRPGVITTSGC